MDDINKGKGRKKYIKQKAEGREKTEWKKTKGMEGEKEREGKE